MTSRSCELARLGEPQCGARASWLVAVGFRQSDAQSSCGRHLNRTCEVMEGAEDRDAVRLTVTRITHGGTEK